MNNKMNTVLSFFGKQQGLCNNLTYDFALPRLCVHKTDNWKGITPCTYSSDYNPDPPIFSAKFANCKNYLHILAIANEDGKIALQDTNVRNTDFEEKALEGKQCHFNAVFDLEWAPALMKFVSASGDHTARLWEVTESDIVISRIFEGHTRSVKTAAFRKTDSAVFATGGRDGAILIWDTRAALSQDLTPRADNCIFSGHVGGPGTPVSQKRRSRIPKINTTATTSSITGLVFQDDMTLISCGAGDGIIKVWDMRRNYTCYKREPLPKFSLPYAGSSTFKGFTNLVVDKSGTRLYANCMDNTIYCYNLSSYSTKPLQKYIGLRNGTFYIKSCLSPDGNYLLSGSSDEKAYIWNVNNSKPLVALCGHTVEVTCVAWSASYNMPIVTCSDDARHKIWRTGPEKLAPNEKSEFRGYAEYYKEYSKCMQKSHTEILELSPQSSCHLLKENETTPNSIEKSRLKRSFYEMDDGAGDANDQKQKRSHIETRGRRLFSPSTSTDSFNMDMGMNITNSLPPILEEKDCYLDSAISHSEDSNQENSLNTTQNVINTCSYSKSVTPLSERRDSNLNATSNSETQNISSVFSPTYNLPNYVLDGEAPHLHIMSPKKKEKVDWLTKFREKMLMSGRGNFPDKLSNNETCDNENNLERDICLSPKLQNLKVSENNSKLNGTPKRRISHSGSSNDCCSHQKSIYSRRNSETSILKFLTVTQPSSNESQRKGV